MWKTSEYTAVGRVHLKVGIPCQDKVCTYKNDDVTVVSLADGAGSAKLSHFGAEAVLERVSSDLGDHFEEYFAQSNVSAIRQRLFSKVLDALEETQSRLQCDLRDLSSTLLATAVCGSRYFIVHIGDGVIGYLKDDKIKVASGPDNGEFVNETFFTTTPSALSCMRILKGTDDKIGGFVLMSDGTENALYNKRTHELSQGIKRIMQMTVLCPDNSMRELLSETFTSAVMSLTQDDCSISILANTKAFPAYCNMSISEKLNLLQIGCNARDKTKRIRQVGEILYAASKGASAAQIARQVHINPKHIIKKLNSLVSLGLLERNQGIYHSVSDEIYTASKSIHHKESEVIINGTQPFQPPV